MDTNRSLSLRRLTAVVGLSAGLMSCGSKPVALLASTQNPELETGAAGAQADAGQPAAAAALAYATVDVGRVFEGHYKRAAAEAQVEQLRAALEERLGAARAELLQRAEAAKTERERVLALPEGPERETATEALRVQFQQGAQFERALATTANQYRQFLAQRANEATRMIRAEIDQAIERYAEQNRLELVLDTSAVGPSGLPVFAYAHHGNDCSQLLLTELNANRPPQMVAPAADLTDIPTVDEIIRQVEEGAGADGSASETQPAQDKEEAATPEAAGS